MEILGTVKRGIICPVCDCILSYPTSEDIETTVVQGPVKEHRFKYVKCPKCTSRFRLDYCKTIILDKLWEIKN